MYAGEWQVSKFGGMFRAAVDKARVGAYRVPALLNPQKEFGERTRPPESEAPAASLSIVGRVPSSGAGRSKQVLYQALLILLTSFCLFLHNHHVLAAAHQPHQHESVGFGLRHFLL